MIKIANTQFWVHDQDEALRFYTKVLGWEVRADVTMQEWSFRWLVVGPAGQDRRRPGADAGARARRCSTPTAARRWPSWWPRAPAGTLFLETDDCQASYDELSARGVTFNDPPTAAALRHRHLVPRPVGQQHPPDPGAGVRPGPRDHALALRALGGIRGRRLRARDVPGRQDGLAR